MKNASFETLSSFFCYHKVYRCGYCHPEVDLGSLKNRPQKKGIL